MSQSTSIGAPIVAVRSQDPALLIWINTVLQEPVSSEVLPGSRFAIYGEDHSKFLTSDNHDNKLTQCRGALCLDRQVENSYLDLYRHNITHVIYRNEPFAVEVLRLALLAAGDKSAIDSCGSFQEFNPPPQVTDQAEFPIIFLNNGHSYESRVTDFFERNSLPDELFQAVCLCLKEAVTNAIFHGFREAGTHNRKYTPDTFHGLYDDDYVAASLTLTPEWLSVRVWDNSGSLGPLSVANSLDRHASNAGLMDSRGRGFYLMQKLSQRLVVCIRRRKETSVQMYFLRQPATQNSLRHLEVVTLSNV